ALMKALADDDQILASQASHALGKIGEPAVGVLVEALDNKNDKVRIQAAWAIKASGPRAKAAVPDLTKILKSNPAPELRQPVIDALGQIGPAAKEAATALLEIAKDEKQPVNASVHVVVALGKIGPDAKEAGPYLVELIKN